MRKPITIECDGSMFKVKLVYTFPNITDSKSDDIVTLTFYNKDSSGRWVAVVSANLDATMQWSLIKFTYGDLEELSIHNSKRTKVDFGMRGEEVVIIVRNFGTIYQLYVGLEEFRNKYVDFYNQ